MGSVGSFSRKEKLKFIPYFKLAAKCNAEQWKSLFLTHNWYGHLFSIHFRKKYLRKKCDKGGPYNDFSFSKSKT
jgi:hypothetical protein